MGDICVEVESVQDLLKVLAIGAVDDACSAFIRRFQIVEPVWTVLLE